MTSATDALIGLAIGSLIVPRVHTRAYLITGALCAIPPDLDLLAPYFGGDRDVHRRLTLPCSSRDCSAWHADWPHLIPGFGAGQFALAPQPRSRRDPEGFGGHRSDWLPPEHVAEAGNAATSSAETVQRVPAAWMALGRGGNQHFLRQIREDRVRIGRGLAQAAGDLPEERERRHHLGGVD
jgi:hypothetical protein